MREILDTYEARAGLRFFLFCGFFCIWLAIVFGLGLPGKIRVLVGLQPHFFSWLFSFLALYFTGAIPCYILAEISLKLELFIDRLKGGSQ